VVEIVRKGRLPTPGEVPESLRAAASHAPSVTLREPRPIGFPLLFSSDTKLIEPAVAFLHEHGIQRAHSAETLRTYTEILYDWFDSLEQSRIAWIDVDTTDLIAYRNRMVKGPSAHTGRPYSVRTINHRVRGVLRFYAWAVRTGWLASSPLSDHGKDFSFSRHVWGTRRRFQRDEERSLFALRQFEDLPRPLRSEQARELLAALQTPYDLMARWQLYTGLRVAELMRLKVRDVEGERRHPGPPEPSYRVIDVIRKGPKAGYVIAPISLLDETASYLALHRKAWVQRAARKRGTLPRSELFLTRRGLAVRTNTYQQVLSRAGDACGFKVTSHLLRATFGCWMLARLEQLAKQGAPINPLLIVKILMAHEHIDTTDRYLRAVAIDTTVLADVLDTLLPTESRP
jgi:integrase